MRIRAQASVIEIIWDYDGFLRSDLTLVAFLVSFSDASISLCQSQGCGTFILKKTCSNLTHVDQRPGKHTRFAETCYPRLTGTVALNNPGCQLNS